jgi:hypothetical protein
MSARFASIAAGQQRPPDYENYLQCHQCGNIIPVYEAASTPQIKNSTETIDNALEQGKFVLDSIPKRGTIKGNKEADKRRRERTRTHHKDPEIDALLRIYGEENVHIIQDTDP